MPLPAVPRVPDLVDQLVGLDAFSPIYAVRHERDKVVAATQGSYDALFDPALPDLSLTERLLVALLACRLTGSPDAAAHYGARLRAAGAATECVNAVAHGPLDEIGNEDDHIDPRLKAMLHFTRVLIESPIDGDRALLHTLPAAGLSTPAVVALAQLVAFLSFQTRLVAGLQAMRSAEVGSDFAPLGDMFGRGGAPEPQRASGLLANPIVSHGFTNETLGWKAWLDVVALDQATPEQIKVLEESHPKAKVSDYYLLLVHQPEILRQRSTAFNAIMYATGGMPRAERELGATVTSRINGCVYCASVHAQRFEQLAKRNDVVAEVFNDPRTAGTTERERAIAHFSVRLTEAPGTLGADDIAPLHAVGLSQLEILDLVHSIAIFAWANRLMLNLGEPVRE